MHGYPRPQLRRANWTSLNGEWEFAIDLDARWQHPSQVQWDRTIVSRGEIESVANDAGALTGLGDGRSIGFGRFVVTAFAAQDA